MGFPAIKKDKYSYADYLTWHDGIRREIIDGIVYEMKFDSDDEITAMSPAPNRRHQEISGNLFMLISVYLKGKSCRVYTAPFDVRLSKMKTEEKEIFNIVQPDLSVFCDQNKLDDKGAKGSPDWAIEILSPFSVKRDLGIKNNLYQVYGVQEYWVIDPVKETILVYTPNDQNMFSTPKEFIKEAIVTPVLFTDLKISLQDVFSI